MTAMTADSDTRELERIVGRTLTSVTRARWGFANRTDIVTTAGGDRLVVQRYRDGALAAHRIKTMAALAGPLAQRGIPTPVVQRVQLDDDPPWATFDLLAGVPVPDAGVHGLGGAQFPHLAMRMGDLQRRIATVPVEGLDLPGAWADPRTLAADASGWLDQIADGIGVGNAETIRRTIAEVGRLFRDRPAVLAHGDFAPVNVLVADGEITGLLDFESTRLADPLFDVAWWAWVVGFHHQADLARSLPSFLEGVAVQWDARLNERIRALQLLRLLELATLSPEEGQATWIARLDETLGRHGRFDGQSAPP